MPYARQPQSSAHTPPWYLPYPPPNRTNTGIDLFHILTGLLHHEGAHITYGPLDDEAHWDATTRTLTLRDGDSHTDHTYALSEFCRRWQLGEAYSHYVDTGRHLQAVT